MDSSNEGVQTPAPLGEASGGGGVTVELLQCKLATRNRLIKELVDSYLKDVCALLPIKEALKKRETITSLVSLPGGNEHLAKGCPVALEEAAFKVFDDHNTPLSSLPSISLSTYLPLRDPPHCYFQVNPCSTCGGTLDIVVHHATASLELKRDIAKVSAEKASQEFQFKTDLSNLEIDRDKIRRLHAQLSNKVAKLETQNAGLAKEVAEQAVELKQLGQDFWILKNDSHSTKTQLRVSLESEKLLSQQVDVLQSEKAQLISDTNELRLGNDTAVGELEDINARSTSLLTKFQVESRAFEQCRLDLSKALEHASNVEHELKSTRKELTDMKESTGILGQLLQEENQISTSLRKKKKDIEAELHKCMNKITDYTRECSKQKKESSHLRSLLTLNQSRQENLLSVEASWRQKHLTLEKKLSDFRILVQASAKFDHIENTRACILSRFNKWKTHAAIARMCEEAAQFHLIRVDLHMKCLKLEAETQGLQLSRSSFQHDIFKKNMEICKLEELNVSANISIQKQKVIYDRCKLAQITCLFQIFATKLRQKKIAARLLRANVRMITLVINLNGYRENIVKSVAHRFVEGVFAASKGTSLLHQLELRHREELNEERIKDQKEREKLEDSAASSTSKCHDMESQLEWYIRSIAAEIDAMQRCFPAEELNAARPLSQEIDSSQCHLDYYRTRGRCDVKDEAIKDQLLSLSSMRSYVAGLTATAQSIEVGMPNLALSSGCESKGIHQTRCQLGPEDGLCQERQQHLLNASFSKAIVSSLVNYPAVSSKDGRPARDMNRTLPTSNPRGSQRKPVVHMIRDRYRHPEQFSSTGFLEVRSEPPHVENNKNDEEAQQAPPTRVSISRQEMQLGLPQAALAVTSKSNYTRPLSAGPRRTTGEGVVEHEHYDVRPARTQKSTSARPMSADARGGGARRKHGWSLRGSESAPVLDLNLHNEHVAPSHLQAQRQQKQKMRRRPPK